VEYLLKEPLTTLFWTLVGWVSFLHNFLSSLPLMEPGAGSGSKGFYPTSLVSALHKGMRCSANDISSPVKGALLLGSYIKVSFVSL
jgi:hypothetical protein